MKGREIIMQNLIQLLQQNGWWLSLLLGGIGIIISPFSAETKKMMISLFKWLRKPTSVIIILLIIIMVQIQ